MIPCLQWAAGETICHLPPQAAHDQRPLRALVPENRRRAYDVRAAIETLADVGSPLELRVGFGVGIVTTLVMVEGIPLGCRPPPPPGPPPPAPRARPPARGGGGGKHATPKHLQFSHCQPFTPLAHPDLSYKNP